MQFTITRRTSILLIFWMIFSMPMLFLLPLRSQAQIFKASKNAHKPNFKPSQQCLQLGKNRHRQTKAKFAKKNEPYEYKLIGVKTGEHPSEKVFSLNLKDDAPKEKTSNRFNKEQVKKENKLPEPSSAKHERIRKEVEETLNKKKGEDPIEVEPLYFITGQEEFAFMDMDPFLKAVEYALHGKMVLVEGHTDSNGKAEDNLKLSMRRVDRIKQLMIDIGVSEDLISVIGYGEAEPKYDNNTEEGRQKNRRVDFKVF